jgi:hypothetical protein
MSLYGLLADVVVVVHGAFVGAVVFGLAAILIGAPLRWNWVRNFWIRLVHLAMIGLVVVQALLGIPCPLTVLEDDLRRAAGETVEAGTFIGRCVHNLIFYEAPPAVFTWIYCIFGAVVVATLLLIPPRMPRWRPSGSVV